MSVSSRGVSGVAAVREGVFVLLFVKYFIVYDKKDGVRGFIHYFFETSTVISKKYNGSSWNRTSDLVINSHAQSTN